MGFTKRQGDFFETSFYLAVDDKTRHYTYEEGAKRTSSIHTTDDYGTLVPRSLRVNNGRGNQDLKLDNASFELVDCPTKLSTKDFYTLQTEEDPTLKKKYYDEVSELVKSKLGCDECIIFHHQVRNKAMNGVGGVDGYVSETPHTDIAPVSGDETALYFLSGDPSEYDRYCYLNLWRNITDSPIENDNLIMLDERTTVKPDDYITNDQFEKDESVVNYHLNARHADIHKWYYFPKMRKDEGILLKQMDSDWTKPGRMCFHMSANDPTIQNYATRESIEVRMMCYWKTASGGVNSMPTMENTSAALIKDPLKVAEDLSPSFGSPRLIAKRVFRYIFKKKMKMEKYSGKPEDYLDRFVTSVKVFQYWDDEDKEWTKDTMKEYKSEPDEGIAAITKEMVIDEENEYRTRAFSRKEKREIRDYLLSNETFMQVAKREFGRLL